VILGEGAAAVVVEPLSAAARRGASVRAVLHAVGLSCDAHHVTAPLRAGVRRAIEDAHARAGVRAEQIDVVLAHGTGTVLNDRTEAQALADAWGTAGRRPPVTSLKSMIGHTSGASGLMSLVAAVEVIARRRVPPTLNHTRTISELAGFPVVTRTAPVPVRTAQVNAFGFGGVNAVAVLGRPPERVAAVDCSPSRVSDPVPVVVTGLGLAAPGLSTVDDLLVGAAVAAGGTHVASAAPFDPVPVLGARGLRYLDRASVLGLGAVARALADAGLPAGPADEPDAFCGVVVSSTLAVVDTVCRTAATLHLDGVRGVSPMDLPNASANAVAAAVAIRYRLAGPNLTIGAGPAGGLGAVHLAASAIRAGRARRIVVIGVEPAGVAAQRLVRDTLCRHGGDPASARLFDGAVAVVVESAPSAAERGAVPHAVVERYGHDATLAAAAASALAAADAAAPRGVGLWLLPCLAHPAGSGQVDAAARHPALSAAGPGVRRLDLAALTGEAAGALGVVQCAVAAAWLAGRRGHRALASGGGCWGDDYVSLTLRGDL
jgi:3-oxoacyl-[acyl-carrier-protein] synthase II